MKRRVLDPLCWVDQAQGWLQGHDVLFEELRALVSWEKEERWMYERRVAVPRLVARALNGRVPQVVLEMGQALGRYYGTSFRSISFALYRDGQDSVTWHRDRDLQDYAESLIAVVSLGGPRRFAVRPYALAGPLGPYAPPLPIESQADEIPDGITKPRRSCSFSVGWGDVLVMGGACQRTWEHSVPKVAHAEPRLAIMYRERRFQPPPATS